MKYSWPGFELDPGSYELLHDGEVVELQPRVVDVLTYLLVNRDRVVTKEELLDNIWGDRFVGESALTSQIKHARRAVGDDGDQQLVIRTVFGRGYRFVAPVTVVDGDAPISLPTVAPRHSIAGRGRELIYLRHLLDEVASGTHRVAFIAGEAGIGKTTLVDTFVAGAVQEGARVAIGNAIPQRGEQDWCSPVLDALTDLERSGRAADLAAVLAERAPAWLLQLSWIASSAELETARLHATEAGAQPTLREFIDAVEELARVEPLIMVLEDLHWADPSTLDVIEGLARRRTNARVLLIATYRPAETTDEADGLHRMARELTSRGLASLLDLKVLSPEAVDELVCARFGDVAGREDLVAVLSERAGGVPLFVHELLDSWITSEAVQVGESGIAVDDLDGLVTSIPSSTREVIAQTVERLPESHIKVLEVASVAGPTFSAAAIAAPLGLAPSTVERLCVELAELGVMIEARGETSWPDMTISSQFGFVHALYQEVLYQRLTAARRAELHATIGHRIELAFSSERRAVANELAAHFLASHDTEAAVRYSLMAADVQLQRGAHREATELLIAARQLLVIQPGSIDRDRHELQLLIAMGNASLLAQGYSADSSIALYEEARVLSEQIGEGRHLLPVYYGLWKNANGRGHFELTSKLTIQFLELAQAYGNDTELLVANRARAWSLMQEGDLATARTHLDHVVTFDGNLGKDEWVSFGEHPIIVGMSSLAWLCWTAADADEAREWSERAVAAGRHLGHPLTQCYTLFIDGLIRQWYGEVEAAMDSAREALEVADVHDFQLWRAWATSILGWAMARSGQIDEGLARIEAGLAAAENVHIDMWRGFFVAAYADALRAAGRDAEALSAIDQALLVADQTNERFFQSDLLRHRGSILATMGEQIQAQSALRAAIDIADRHGWLAFGERAGIELNKLLSAGDK